MSQSQTIVCRFNGDANQWVAAFDDAPQVAFGGDMPVKAIRRLLEVTDVHPDSYILLCDRDLAGSGILRRSIIWNPPELLFPCGDCDGRGEYVGLLERKVCPTCGGRKVVPV